MELMLTEYDLRIGNFVIAEGIHKGKVMQVNEMRFYKPEGYIIHFKGQDTGEYIRDCKGIPLTEDWLLKLGFERVKNRYHDNYKIAIGDGFHSVQIRDGNYFYSNDESDAGCYVITEITYVHQLQNLHFAITGIELTIKEPVNNIS